MRKNIILLLFFNSIFLIGSVSADEMNDVMYNRGIESLQSGNLSEAISCFEKIYETDPDYRSVKVVLVKAYKFRGIDHYLLSQYDEALELWKRAMNLDPRNEEIPSYIERTLGEIRALNAIAGIEPEPDNDTFISDTAIAEPRQPPHEIVSNSPVGPPVINEINAEPEETDYDLPVVAGLRVGPAFPIGKAISGYKIGWQFEGNASIFPDNLPFGLRLAGQYIRLPMERPSTTPPAIKNIISIAGAGVNAVTNLKSSNMFALRSAIGFGVYEVMQAGFNEQLMRENYAIDLTLGYSLEIGLSKKFDRMTFSTEVRYLHVETSLAPDLLQINAGIDADL